MMMRAPLTQWTKILKNESFFKIFVHCVLVNSVHKYCIKKMLRGLWLLKRVKILTKILCT